LQTGARQAQGFLDADTRLFHALACLGGSGLEQVFGIRQHRVKLMRQLIGR
jgi:hypothetical protein